MGYHVTCYRGTNNTEKCSASIFRYVERQPVSVKFPYVPEDNGLQCHCRENIKSHKSSFILCLIHFIHSSMVLQPFVGPWPILQFRNHFYTVGLLGRVISPSQVRYLHTGQHKHRIYAHTDIHALSAIRTHDLSVRPSEDISCL
jgi:hypothetical protein